MLNRGKEEIESGATISDFAKQQVKQSFITIQRILQKDYSRALFFNITDTLWGQVMSCLTTEEILNLSVSNTFAFYKVFTNCATGFSLYPIFTKGVALLAEAPHLIVDINLLRQDFFLFIYWAGIAETRLAVAEMIRKYNGESGKIVNDENYQERVEELKKNFVQKQYSCPLCPLSYKQVSFQYQLKSSISTEEFGKPFLACNDCDLHNVWSHEKALTIWGFTEHQMGYESRYVMQAMSGNPKFYYCTAGLSRLHKTFAYHTSLATYSEFTPSQSGRLSDLLFNIKLAKGSEPFSDRLDGSAAGVVEGEIFGASALKDLFTELAELRECSARPAVDLSSQIASLAFGHIPSFGVESAGSAGPSRFAMQASPFTLQAEPAEPASQHQELPSFGGESTDGLLSRLASFSFGRAPLFAFGAGSTGSVTESVDVGSSVTQSAPFTLQTHSLFSFNETPSVAAGSNSSATQAVESGSQLSTSAEVESLAPSFNFGTASSVFSAETGVGAATIFGGAKKSKRGWGAGAGAGAQVPVVFSFDAPSDASSPQSAPSQTFQFNF